MAETAAPARPAEHLDRAAGYEEDFVLWTERQAALIRARQLDLVDWDNVAEEIESLGSGFALRTFPKALPHTAEQILDEDFFPGPIDEKS